MIISLVTDSKSRTPFVKLVNRMIVLLSRARIGLYIVGNMGYFENKTADHWSLTLQMLNQPAENDITLEKKASQFSYDGIQVGPKLPICCPLHRKESTAMVSDVKKLTLNFCEIICEAKLICGHICALKCHWSNSDVHNKQCGVAIDSPCVSHSAKIPCFKIMAGFTTLDAALAAFRCQVKVDIRLPCSHVVHLKCDEESRIAIGDLPLPTCCKKAIEPYIYPGCKHAVECLCKELALYKSFPTKIKPCSELVDFTAPCGHKKKAKCYLMAQSGTFVCAEQVTKTLPRCGHSQKMSCSEARSLNSWSGISCDDSNIIIEGVAYGLKDHSCLKKVDFLRKCGHTISVECGKAFEFALNPPICNIQEQSISPICGHTLMLACDTRGRLKSMERTTPPVRIVDASDTMAGFMKVPTGTLINCAHKVTFRRKCGHEDQIECRKAQNMVGPCLSPVEVSNPICSHMIALPCHMSTLWKPWNDEFLNSSVWRLIRDHKVVTEDLPAICAPPEYINKSLKKCNHQVTFRRLCEHELTLKCCDAFRFATSKPPPCEELVRTTLKCGHEATLSCTELNAGREVKSIHSCKEIAVKRCWNFLVCDQEITTVCSDVDATCSSIPIWTCEFDHQLKLKCKMGTPSNCPACEDSSLERFISVQQESTLTKEDMPYHIRPEINRHFNLLVVQKSELHRNFNSKLELLERYKSWTEKKHLADWEKPLFRPKAIPVYIQLLSGRGQDFSDFAPKNFMKSQHLGGGIQAAEWNADNLRNTLASSKSEKITLLLGYAFSCRALLAPKIPAKREIKVWAQTQIDNAYDMVLMPDGMLIFWSPFCLLATHKSSFTQEQLGRIISEMEPKAI